MTCVCARLPVSRDDSPDEDSPLPAALAEQILTRIKRGATVRAWSLSRSSGLAEPSLQNSALALKKLAPKSLESCTVLPPCVDLAGWHPTVEDLTRAIDHLKPGRAMDSGGWSHELWQSLCQSCVLRPRIVAWLQQAALLLPAQPLRICLLHQRPVLLCKTGGGIRPILIGCVPFKAVHAAVTATMRRDLAQFLEGAQFGVGTHMALRSSLRT